MAVGFYRDIEPEDLPAPDAQVLQLIRYIMQEDARVDKITDLITMNPVLTTQLLRFANSAFFQFRHKVKTISEAVVAMGMARLTNLVLCFAVKEALSQKTILGFDANTFWEDSVRRGVAARQLGLLIKGPAEEAFTAGMLQDIGLLVLFSMEPDKADRFPLLRANPPWQRHKMETALFRTTHDAVGALLAEKWNFPSSYTRAIGSHHHILKSNERWNRIHETLDSTLAGMMHYSDLCNAFYTCHDKSGALIRLIQNGKQLFGLKKDTVNSLLSMLPDQVKKASTLLRISTGRQLDYSMVMEQAGHRLADDNIGYQELTWQLQKSLKERDEAVAGLRAELDAAREIQKSLQPDIIRFRRVTAFNIPARHLSGDFYDYFQRSDGTICFCLGDVSGKGTAAALLMAKTVSLFRCLCKVMDDISRIVQLMNNELCETAIRGMFVTFVGGWFDPETQKMNIVNLGHIPPLLVREKQILKIEASDPPLGVLPDVIRPARQISIRNGRLYLFTDGFTEGRLKMGDRQGSELGLNGFMRWLVSSGKMPLTDQAEWIKDQCGSLLAPQSDDLTLMIISGEQPGC